MVIYPDDGKRDTMLLLIGVPHCFNTERGISLCFRGKRDGEFVFDILTEDGDAFKQVAIPERGTAEIEGTFYIVRGDERQVLFELKYQ